MSTSTIEHVRTDRLTCERLRADHGEELSRLLLDPRVARSLWPLKPPSSAELAANLAAKIDHWRLHGFGQWLVRDRTTGEMVGRGGLQYSYGAHLHEIEAGWAIVPERWGEGLGTELAIASVDAAFGALGLRAIVALALPHNQGSRRVMEKAGFGYEREIEHLGMRHVLYRRLPEPG